MGQSGTVKFNGGDLTDKIADAHASASIGYVPQGRDVFAGLTVKQSFMIGESIGGDSTALYDQVYEFFPILEERAEQDAGTMSGGQQQMLAIGRALVGDPDLLLIDEPSEGIQPSIVQSLTEDLAEITEAFGTTILFVEQNLSVIQGLAERCYAMDHGRIVDSIDDGGVRDRKQIEAYLVV